MMKSIIIIEDHNGYISRKMWIDHVSPLETVIESGKRDLLEEELLDINETKKMYIDTCQKCGKVLIADMCNC